MGDSQHGNLSSLFCVLGWCDFSVCFDKFVLQILDMFVGVPATFIVLGLEQLHHLLTGCSVASLKIDQR